MKYGIAALVSLSLLACGDDSSSSSASAGESTTSAGSSTASSMSTSDPTGSGSTSTSTATSEGSTASTGVDPTASTGEETTSTTGPGSTTSTGETMTTGEASGTTVEDTSTTDGVSTGTDTDTDTDTDTSSGTDTEDPGACMIADVEDTLSFTYVKTIDLVDINTIQASYYNIKDQEIVFFSYYGKGRRFSIDGQALGDVTAPAEALPKLDGASYDQVSEVALLLTQDCRLVEADPVTLQTLKTIQLDTVKFKIGVCAGVAIGVDGDMYVISWQTEEMVKMSRDGQTELGRVDLAALDLSRPDGISLIAGSENFLVLSSQKQQAAILTPKGAIVVPPGPVGKDVPPFKGGMIPNSDASLTVCGNGHAWLCEEYGTHCHDFAPEGGDKDACACTIPQ
ncbi:MAG: hypothetical protein R3B09_05830 [Nannocystaceae bacterium]